MAHSPMRASRRQTTEAAPWQAQTAVLRYVPSLISSCGKPIGATPLPWLYCGCFAHSFHSPRSGSAISSLLWQTASSYFRNSDDEDRDQQDSEQAPGCDDAQERDHANAAHPQPALLSADCLIVEEMICRGPGTKRRSKTPNAAMTNTTRICSMRLAR
jgi:hypothetical protein